MSPVLRKLIAVAGLAVLGALILAAGWGDGALGDSSRLTRALVPLLVPLAVTVLAVVRESPWGRWLGLAAGIVVLPWAAAFLVAPSVGTPIVRPAVALAAAAALLVSLSGRAMFERYEGRATGVDWRGPRMTLVRWTVICNLASVLALYGFTAAYEPRVAWRLAIPGALLLGLLPGLLLLARQRTAGLLLVAISCVGFVPAGWYFVWREAGSLGEAVLFGVVFLPGVLTAWASLIAFGRPIAGHLAGRP
jgi:hypothetical protein